MPVLSPDMRVSSQTAQPPWRFRLVGLGGAEGLRVSGDSHVPRLKTAGLAQARVWVPGLLLPRSVSRAACERLLASFPRLPSGNGTRQTVRKRTGTPTHTTHAPMHMCTPGGSSHRGQSPPRGWAAPSTQLALPSSECCHRGGTRPLSPVPVGWGRGTVRSPDPQARCAQGRVLVPVPVSRVGVWPRTLRGGTGRTSPGARVLLLALPRASLALLSALQGSGRASACT